MINVTVDDNDKTEVICIRDRGKFLLIFCILLLLPQITFAQLAIIGKGEDTTKPIDIESDSLVLKPEQNMAVFKGSVKAVQGAMTLLSDQMVVFYHDKEKEGEPLGGQLSKIETYGNVVLTVPDKKAEAEKGIYDVDQSFITMTGKVVITQGGNRLKGDKFVYNVATGESKMETADLNGEKKPDSKKPAKQRVKGVFIPKAKPER